METIGPVAVAVGMFPVAARTALKAPGGDRAVAVLRRYRATGSTRTAASIGD